jgi:hypothetical protein
MPVLMVKAQAAFLIPVLDTIHSLAVLARHRAGVRGYPLDLIVMLLEER